MIKGLKKALLIGGLILAGGAYSGNNLGNENKDNLKYINERYENFKASKLEELLRKEREAAFNQKAEEQSSDEIITPYYKLSPNSCSKYARLSAKKLFDKKYNPGHAWDLKYDNKIVYEFKDNETANDSTTNESLKNLIIGGTLKPGMIIVAKRDMKPGEHKKYKSYRGPGKDEKGNKIEDTHVILYLGINDKGEEEFSDQWINQMGKITVNKFKDRKNLKPTLILDELDKTPI